MKVSFDFDSTLTYQHVEDFASSLIKKGVEVWIVTSRHDGSMVDIPTGWNDEVLDTALRLGIPLTRIKFTNGKDKAIFFKDNEDFVWHLDDDWVEINQINLNTEVKGVTHIGNSKTWKQHCKDLLGI